mgnify:FL=1
MSPSVVDRRIEWNGPDRGEVFSRTVELQTWAGERVDVIVGPETAGLVLHDDTVVAVLMSGHHAVHVLRHDEEPGDVDRREFASRMRTEVERVDWLRARARHLRAESRLVFVSVGALLFVEFGGDAPVIFRDRRRGDLPLEIQGAARLVVTDPVRFHASFLHGCEDLRATDFERIVSSMIEAGLAETLGAATDDVEAVEPDPSTFAARATAHLRPGLATLGLDVEAIEVTRLETPVGVTPAPTTPSPSLATPSERR